MLNQGNRLWNQVLDLLSDQMSKPSFETWIKSTKAKVEGDKWFIIAPNEFSRDWLESKYLSDIKDAIYMITKEPSNVMVVTDEKIREGLPINCRLENILNQIELLSSGEREKLFSILNGRFSREPQSYSEATKTNLNSNYTFKNFIVSTGNRFAHAASQSVAEAPGKAYNPLFIYGSTGLGRTHLLHAIGNYVLENNRFAKVVYVTAEQFTNEFIESIRDNRSNDFRNKYRQADVLLFDDVQYLAGKEQTQEEFFHTFNHLHEKSKQIVLSSDCPPKEIHGIMERLMTRFTWGLLTDLLPQGRDTQRDMIELLCEREQIQIPAEVINFLEEQEFGNVTEILSALKTIAAYQELTKEFLTIDMVKDLLQTTQPDKYTEKLDRVSLVENEVKQLKKSLHNLHAQVESLMGMLVNPNSINTHE